LDALVNIKLGRRCANWFLVCKEGCYKVFISEAEPLEAQEEELNQSSYFENDL
jgi:hypothetical protein